MAVRLFVGNLSYSTTEADLRTYFGSVAQPSQVVLPVDRETGRPRGFAFVEFIERPDAEQAIQRFNGQMFNGRPLAVSEARAREDRGPGGPPRPGGFSGPRPGGGFSGPPRPGGFSGGPRPGGGGGFSGPPRVRSARHRRHLAARATSDPTRSRNADRTPRPRRRKRNARADRFR